MFEDQNPWASTFKDLRSVHLDEKKAKKDYDGDGKVETGSKEHAGVVHNAIQRAKGGKADGKDTRKEDVTINNVDGTKTEIVDVVKAPAMIAAPKFSNWQEELHWEALKGKKLDVQETGVKNKIEINPTIATEHHQKDEDGNVIEHEDGTPASVEEGAPYTVNRADKLGNTPAYQNFKKGMKNKLTGDPLYKAGVGLDKASKDPEGEQIVDEGMAQARKNVGASTCWKGYKAKGTKMKGGKSVPNCVKEEDLREKKKGLWDNIHAKKKRMKAGSGEKKAKKGDEDYPKTLNVEATFLSLEEKKKLSNTAPLSTRVHNWSKQVATNEGVMATYGGESKKKTKDTGVTSDKKLKDIRKVYVGASYEQDADVLQELDLKGGLKKVGSTLKRGLKKVFSGPVMKPNMTKDQHMNKIRSSGGDPSHWANSYEPEGEMVEAKVDKKIPEYKRATARDKRYGNPHGSLELGGGIRKDRRADHEKKRGMKKEGYKGSMDLSHMQTPKQKKEADARLKKANEKSYRTVKKKEEQKEGTSYGIYKGDGKPKGAMAMFAKKKKEKKEVKEDMKGMSQKSGDKRSTESGAGMTAKGVAKYNRRTGGDLKTAVTTPPSKLKAGSKAAGRRKSFCARSKSWDGPRGKAARRRWNCEFTPDLPMLPEEKKKDTALDIVKKGIIAKYGKKAIMRKGSNQPKKVRGAKSTAGTNKYKDMADRKKQTASDAKKRGFKDSKSYIETMARHGGKKNYDSGRGLGS